MFFKRILDLFVPTPHPTFNRIFRILHCIRGAKRIVQIWLFNRQQQKVVVQKCVYLKIESALQLTNCVSIWMPQIDNRTEIFYFFSVIQLFRHDMFNGIGVCSLSRFLFHCFFSNADRNDGKSCCESFAGRTTTEKKYQIIATRNNRTWLSFQLKWFTASMR